MGPQTPIDLDLCYALFGVCEDCPPRQLVEAARATGWTMPQLVLSVLARGGELHGSGAQDELARACARLRRYRELAQLASAAASARVVKGPSLARHYPPGILRPVGDLDLVVADEDALWRAVRAVLAVAPVTRVDVSLFGYPDRAVLAALYWPAEDPLLDDEYQVDICTAAFTGDGGAVHVRWSLPENQLLADLLSLAEERFQRPFNAKDVVDVAVLGQVDLPPPAQIAAAAADWLLAPELLELLTTAQSTVELGALAESLVPLTAAAARESSRRESWKPGLPLADPNPVLAALASGRPVGGLPLGEVGWRADMPRARMHAFGAGSLLRTPVGDYLLTDQEVVSLPQYEAATAELARLHIDEGLCA